LDESGCQVGDTVEVFSMEAPMAELGADTVICGQGPFVVVPITAMGGEMEWSTGSAAASIDVMSSGGYWLSIQNVCGVAIDTLEVSFVDVPTVDLGGDTLICGDLELEFFLDEPDSSVLWSNGSTGQVLSVSEAGQYWVTVDLSGCISSDTVVVSREDFPTIEPMSDTLLCEFSQQLLVADVMHADLLTWSDGSNDSSLMVNAPGTYQLQASNACGTAFEEVSVGVVPYPELPAELFVCFGGSRLVSLPAGARNVLWSTGATWASEELTEGVYSYAYTDSYGCNRMGELSIVADTASDGLVFVPNVFTPNDDGLNEVFRIIGADNDGFDLMIFNRWGELLFRTLDTRVAWDGTSSGTDVPDGTYVYVLNYRTRCGGTQRIERIGHVTVLR
jgi:gliding motility-associated-like protein